MEKEELIPIQIIYATNQFVGSDVACYVTTSCNFLIFWIDIRLRVNIPNKQLEFKLRGKTPNKNSESTLRINTPNK